ncbi:MAG: 3-methyl-2-oxobutanoate dehydrogenase subunit VorB [Clostridia bacterium]|nr:3-methyl-2-oxobutanoate dehydrogenase subunit VorB [Clostridia bacterium]
MAKILMKGNEAVGEAAVMAGCRYFFGYPITPQSELPHYMVKRLAEVGGVFLQAESEIGAVNMSFGAAGSGARVMTSSSSPGISLKQEGISYLAGAELPVVIVNIMRGGPGLGNIQPTQSDYFQATKGGGHGDYNLIVLAPASVQEIVDLTIDAFDLADKYRNPVMILGDGVLGQMMEPVEIREVQVNVPEKTWATTGAKGRKPNLINSLYIVAERCEEHNLRLQAKFKQMAKDNIRYEDYLADDAEILLVAYGTSARIAKGAIDRAREQGIKVGLVRPISLWPFPYEHLAEVAQKVKSVLVVEMSAGQMIEDVRLALNGSKPVDFYGRLGGMLPVTSEILREIEKLAKGGRSNG